MEQTIDAKRRVRVITFVAAVISSSAGVAFGGLTENFFLLGLVLLPCIVALSLSIVPSSASTGLILTSGIISVVMSAIVIIYTMIKDTDKLREYMPVLFS